MKQTIKKLGIIAAAMIIALAFIACVGPAGLPGADGADGAQGEKGDQGEAGVDGADGAQGDKGDKGDQGDRGDLGLTGADGESITVRVFTVTFDSDGGSAVPSQKNIFEDNWVRRPETVPTKPIQGLDFAAETTAGLYRNAYQFDGWYLENELYDFDTPVTTNFTLKARWSNPPVSVTGTNDVVTNAVNYINAEPGGYTLLLDADVTVTTAQYLRGNINLTLMGITSARTITFDGTTDRLFYLINGRNTLTLGNNITLKGKPKNSSGNAQSNVPLLQVTANNTLIMKVGSRIEGHVANFPASALLLLKDAFFFMEGGTITGNENTSLSWRPNDSAAVQVNGTFVMSGGSITNNTGTDGAADLGTNSAQSIILSGNAQIGGFHILTTPGTANAGDRRLFIEVGSPNVRIGKLSLGYSTDTPATTTTTARDHWVNQMVIKAAEGYTLPTTLSGSGNIIEGYGKFLANMTTNQTSAALSGYSIVNENGVGVLKSQ